MIPDINTPAHTADEENLPAGTERFEMVAKTFQGLEDVLCEELIALGAKNVQTGLRMVSFEGDLEMMYKANLCCRTALRILKPVFKFTADDPDELYDAVRDFEWEKFLTPDSTFAIDSTVNSSEFRHSKYVTYRVKDGIVDHFNDLYGRRPSVRINGADWIFNVHIFESRVTISLDSSGECLSKRGYRVEQTEAPLNEVLAAGIILKTGWRGDTVFADPMCGSGTFLIEAALIASNTNPGIYRKSFAFESWPDFDRELFESLYNDDSEERTPPNPIIGGDIDAEAVAIARKNIANARLGEFIQVECKPLSDWTDNPEEGTVVMNPPYGRRLRPDDMSEFFRSIGNCLKRNFQGWHVWILGYRDEHFDAIRLKPSVKFPIDNGGLDCTLREYVLFDGHYDDFRAEGGSVGKEKYAERDKMKRPVAKRLSDREWEDETRKYGAKDQRRSGRDERSGRKSFRRDDRDDRKSFRRDDREDRKPFRRDDRDDRKPFRRNDRDDRKPFRRNDRDDRKPFNAADKGPRISSDREERFNVVKMRKRKGWTPDDSED